MNEETLTWQKSLGSKIHTQQAQRKRNVEAKRKETRKTLLCCPDDANFGAYIFPGNSFDLNFVHRTVDDRLNLEHGAQATKVGRGRPAR